MRRLTLLFIALAIALFGLHLIADTEDFAPYVLRDGLLLAALAMLIFALNAPAWPGEAKSTTSATENWPPLSGVLIGTGLICAFAGGVGTVFNPSAGTLHTASLILWGLGILLLGSGAWWAGSLTPYTRPAYRWQVDAAGKYVRMALGEVDAPTQSASSHPNRPLLWLLIIIAIAAFVRLWRLTLLPPDCIDTECARALALLNGSAGSTLFDFVARAFFGWTQQSLFSLRLTSVLLGLFTLPAFYLAASQLTRAGGALLATFLLAFSPWHIWASRSTDSWVLLPLLLCLAIGLLLQAQRENNPRFWVMAGLIFGLVIIEFPFLLLPSLLWIFLLVYLSILRTPHATFCILLLPLALLAVALPALIHAVETNSLWPPATQSLTANTLNLLTNLLRQGVGGATTIFTDSPLLDPISAALAMVGFGYLLRYLRHFGAALVVGGFILFGVAIIRMDLTKAAPTSLLLGLLPFFLLSAAAALDSLFETLQQTWRPLLQPARMATAILILLLLLGGRNAFNFTRQLRSITAAGQNSADVAMGRFLVQQLRTASTDTVFFAPASVMANPTTRLLAGSALNSPQVHPLDSALDFVLSGAANKPLLYLVPLADQALLQLLQQLYPQSSIQPQFDENKTQVLFITLQATAAAVAESQGLLALFFAGNDFGDASQATTLDSAGPLEFDWQAQQALTTPFSVQWQGTLLVPAAGNYIFSVETATTNETMFSLHLDNRVVLDSSLGVITQQQTLAKGFYRVDMRYRSGVAPSVRAPAPLTVRWQQPGGAAEIVARNVLHKPALPNVGLLGTYYAGNQWQGPTLDVRKDLLVGLPTLLPQPYSVRWQGKLAAPRAGEYMLATLGEGVNQVTVDDQLIIDNQRPPAETTGEKIDMNYTEGILYLTQGWHKLEVRHAPTENATGLKLLWQPPGSNAAPLTSDYLAPIVNDVAPGDLMLPAAPPLVDARFGDDRFALAQSIDLWKPQVRLPPAQLPPLRFEKIWQAGNVCGNGNEQLNQPHGVAIDPTRRLLYVADTGNRRVRQFTWDGSAGALIQSELFQEPFDVELTPDGSPLVLDSTAQQILHVDPATGNVQALPMETSFYHPRGFTVDSAGNLAVADTGGGRVVILSTTGQVLAEFGKQGSLLAQGQPIDVLAVNGALWAVTAEDGRLWQLDTLGSMTALPHVDTLNGPHLAGLPNGAFFLSDPARNTILYHAATGQPLGQFAYQNTFTTPTGVAVAQIENEVYLAVSDSRACTLSFWRIQSTVLPQ